MKFLICLTLAFVTNLTAKNLFQERFAVNPDSSNNQESNIQGYSIPDSVLEKFPLRNQNNLNRFYPGVVSYFQNFYIRGGKNYETGFYLDGIKFNDLFTGENPFFINPNAFERIDFYNGFIPVDLGNSSSGLFNYKLKTGGDKLNFNVEHLSDNITFTNDAFSGDKRLGTFYYGYNETNLNVGGPLYFNNVKFFANVNYLFQRDKNPQRYLGVDNTTFYDQFWGDSITINLPAGIVPYNSFETLNLLSTLLIDLYKIKIKAFGIYFDENEYTERQHLIEYLNPRLGLIDKHGGIINIVIDHNINEMFSYSIDANYFQKSEITSDQYLGDNYWAYGDSIANAEVGIYWIRDQSDPTGRYKLPTPKYAMVWGFPSSGYPGINHQKSEQEKFTLSGDLLLKFYNHFINIGGDFIKHKLRYWQLPYQSYLAEKYAAYRQYPSYEEYSDEELRDLIARSSLANNIGYDSDGDISNSNLDKAPEPIYYSFYVGDQFKIFNKLFLYFGLKYDHYDFDYKKMVDPTKPEKTLNYNTGIINEEGLVKTIAYSYLSPKVHIDILPFSNLSLSVSYSQNSQSHPFSEIYEGYYSTLYQLYSFGVTSIRIKELKPIKTYITEFGVTYEPINNLNTTLNYFYKKTENYLSLEYMKTYYLSPFRPYFYCGDNGFSNIWGLEFQLDYHFKSFILRTILSYQKGDESINTPLTILTSEGQVKSAKINPETINEINLNALVNYDFSTLNNFSTIFNKLNFSILFTFNGGHPYYYYSPLSRPPMGPYLGTTPNIYQFDLKIEKGLSVLSNLNLNFFIYVINLLDAKNVYDVFPRTGSAEDDGYLSDPNLGGQLVENYGEQFVTLYNLINQYNPLGGQQTFYGPPRQIGFGIKLNY